MIYKRATAQLRKAGIDHIVIAKRLWGAAPEDPRLLKRNGQRSQIFTTWQLAVQAVKDGFRPTDPMDTKELTKDLESQEPIHVTDHGSHDPRPPQ
jgi:hypothetical protein